MRSPVEPDAEDGIGIDVKGKMSGRRHSPRIKPAYLVEKGFAKSGCSEISMGGNGATVHLRLIGALGCDAGFRCYNLKPCLSS